MVKYLSVKQNLRRLKLERLKLYFTIYGISFLIAIALFILYICISSGNDTQDLNKCLKDHNLNYCNKH